MMTRPVEAEAPDLEVSFEFFPPRTPEMEALLWQTIAKLQPVAPDFVSVTYGAGGTSQAATIDTVKRIRQETSLEPASHLTCVGATREAVDAVVRDIAAAGVKHIVALRGDPSGGVGAKYEPHPGGYANGAELVKGVARQGNFEISVSAYPEKHPESFTLEVDLAFLAAKADNGATRAITQFFFDNSAYYRYVDRARARGIRIPIVPGILPVTNFARVREFAARCGTSIPRAFAARFAGLDDDPETRKLVAAAMAAEQVAALREQGVRQFHFYTLNRADLVFAICRMLGLGVARDEAA